MKATTRLHILLVLAASFLTGCATKDETTALIEAQYDSYLEDFTLDTAANRMTYAYYSPVQSDADTTKYPLVIYVHGLFHGWTDESFKKSGLTWWVASDIQEKFSAGGAFLLMPKILESSRTAMQPPKVFALINEFISKNKDSIDTDRIYVMGGSAGGAIAWQLVIDNPGFFKAGVMIAAYRTITEAEAAKVSSLPVWMVSSKTDPLVKFNESQEPNWNALLKTSTVKDKCRWTIFEDEVTLPDGSHPSITHLLAKTIGWNFCTIADRQPFGGMSTIDGNGNAVTLSWDDSLIEWLEAIQ